MLELKDVRAGYDGVEVLHGLSYKFEDGKNYCLLGPNGCGKTTLIRTIASLIAFTGEITMEGVRLRDMKRRELASKVAVLSQVSNIYFPYTVYDTVMLGRYQYMKGIFGNTSKEDKEKVEECLETVKLTDQRDKRIDELSGGQRQRVFLAQVLAQSPQMILLDEPTNHLDVRHQLELIDYLKKWTADGKHSVIGVMHDINLALRLSDSVLIMKDGEFKATGTFDEVVTANLLNETYDTDIAGFMRESFEKWREI
ncbi:MAG: ABC transporter ATP-binding protein [Firmicutes bacterium]|nr:ABC transporter ATP-binding protein [Bacillota bacterium]